MKQISIFFLSCVCLTNCDSIRLDEGAYQYDGIVVDAATKKTLDNVECRLYIINVRSLKEQLHQEIITDSTGTINLEWAGYINKYDARFEFLKEKYELFEYSSTMINSPYPHYYSDTIFMKRLE